MAEKVEMFIDALHPQSLKLLVTKRSAAQQEVIELAHTFNNKREGIDR